MQCNQVMGEYLSTNIMKYQSSVLDKLDKDLKYHNKLIQRENLLV